MKVVIGRFEGEFAVIEMDNEVTVNMPKTLTPKLAKEGDVIEITINEEESEKRRLRMEELKRDS